MNDMRTMNYRDNYRDDYREDYREDYRDEYGRNQRDRYGRNRRNYRYYRDYRDYRSQRDEYENMLEEIVDDSMELARAYEDVSEMASNVNEKQKLMKMAEREKEQYRMIKEMLETHM